MAMDGQGGGDEGAIEILDGGAGGEGGGDEGEEQELPEGGDGESGADGDQGDDGADGRRGGERDDKGEDHAGDRSKLPVQLRKAVREIQAADPEFAKRYPKFEKEISGALFKSQQIDNLGGIASIAATLESIEARGGVDGIESMAADLDAANAFEAALDKGDPKAFETWAKESPNGFARAVLPMIEQLGRVNEERYEQVGSAVVSSIFEKFGAFSVVAALGKAITDGKSEDAAARFNELARFLGDVKRLGGLAKTDPHASRSQELDEREQTIESENQKAFMGSVRADVNTAVTSKMNAQLRTHLITLGVRKVESGTANRMRKEINRELQRVVNSDANYQRQYEAVMGTRDRARAGKFIMAAAERKLPQVIRDVVKDFNLKGSGTGGARRPANGRSGSNGSDAEQRVVNGRPKTSEIDFTRTDKSNWLATMHGHGEAWLKTGRRAKW